MISKEEIASHLDYVLTGTNFSNLGERKVGKVRDIYTQNDKVILISTDRHSSFDRNIAHIPNKGAVLTGVSTFWFDNTKDIVPNHIIAVPDPNVVVAKKCTVIMIEMVVRGYITGVTGTSLWTLYKNGQRDFGDFTLPEGMEKNQKLDTPVLTPTTKNDEHDRPITSKDIIAEGMMTEDLWKDVSAKALELFKRGQEIAAERGLILVDTKYEFGLDENGTVTLIDEIHTPDSSRYWKLDTYAERFSKGEEPDYFDKEFLRLWFKDNCDPYNDAVLPKAPDELVAELSRRYMEIYETITQKQFVPDFSVSLEDRIAANLSNYHVA